MCPDVRHVRRGLLRTYWGVAGGALHIALKMQGRCLARSVMVRVTAGGWRSRGLAVGRKPGSQSSILGICLDNVVNDIQAGFTLSQVSLRGGQPHAQCRCRGVGGCNTAAEQAAVPQAQHFETRIRAGHTAATVQIITKLGCCSAFRACEISRGRLHSANMQPHAMLSGHAWEETTLCSCEPAGASRLCHISASGSTRRHGP